MGGRLMLGAGGGFTGNKWADLAVYLAALVTALGVIWRKVLRPVVRGIAMFERVGPILIDIAGQFTASGLTTTLTRIEGKVDTQGVKLDELHAYAHDDSHQRSTQIAGLAAFDEAITRKVDDLAAKVSPMPGQLDEIKEKVT